MASVMEKILRGALKFNSNGRAKFLTHMEQIASGVIQHEALYITCIDSRVLTTELTSSKPGEIFYVRNPGNMVPTHESFLEGNVSGEAGALELTCVNLKIRNVVICGHSDCKAMEALHGMKHNCESNLGSKESPLRAWVAKNGLATLHKFSSGDKQDSQSPLRLEFQLGHSKVKATIDPDNKQGAVDKLSQVHVLQQASHVSTYPFLQDLISSGQLSVNALWFDFQSGHVNVFSPKDETFVAITEDKLDHLVDSLQLKNH